MQHAARQRLFNSRFMITSLTGLVTLAAMFAAAPAVAQQSPQDPQPYIGVVTGDDVYVRSGAAESYYPYAKVHRGDLVRVTGEKFNWSRIVAVGPVFEREGFFGYIMYPTTQPGRFRLESDGRTGVVLGREDVLAPNLNTKYNPSDSWKPLARLDPNTRVTVIETLTENNRTVQKIQLPPNAEGWISSAYIRPATDEETVAWRRAIGELPESPDDARELAKGEATPDSASDALGREEPPPPRVTTPTPDQKPTPDADQPRNDLPAEPTRDTSNDSSRPNEQPVSQPAAEPRGEPSDPTEAGSAAQPHPTPRESTSRPETPTEPTPESTPSSREPSRARPNEPASVEPPETPDAEEQGDAASSDAASTQRDDTMTEAESIASRLENASLEDLEQAFEQLRKEPIETAEVQPLRRMYESFAEQRAENESEKRFAMARANQLEIWSDVQTRRAEIAELRQRADRTLERTEAARLASDAAADYVAVGRLAASTIYDGRRLPLMLRVQDPGTGRTVAYVEPNDELNLVGMIGQLVGIVGERSYDGGLRLNIVEPRRVDLLAPSR